MVVMRTGLAAGLLCLAIPASGASASEVEIERMTSPEVREALAAGKTIMIIPTGGTEQNGPHMVIGKHNYIVKETARRVAGRLGNALVAPVLAYVPEGDIEKREGHMAYPGTISVPPPIYEQVLESAAASFRIEGFKTVVFLGDSGPNQEPQRVVAAKLSAAWAKDGVRVIQCSKYYAANGGLEWLKSQGESEAAIGTHAAIRDSSELMAVFPEGIRPGKAAADKDGVVGDPTRASAERGAKLLQLKVDTAVDEIEAAMKAPPGGSGGAGAEGTASREEGLLRRLWRRLFG